MELKKSSSGKQMRGTYIAIFIPLGVAINVIGNLLAVALNLPIYLDSIGTIVVSAIMGPWVGVSLGILSNVVMSLMNGNILMSLYAVCSIATGLIVGFMVRYGKFTKIYHLIIATVSIAVVNAFLGAAVSAFVFGGISGGGGYNLLVGMMMAAVNDVFSAQFLISLPANLLDKGLAIVIGWVILKRLPESMKNLAGGKGLKTNS